MDKSYISEIKEILSQARQKAYSSINTAMVEAYWLIGKRIVEEEQQGEKKAAYGESILKELSKTLTAEFGRGFSYANLRNFRQFYLTFPNMEICYTLCSKLSWSHNRLIMRVENSEARTYYLKEAFEQSWSVRTLERNINTFYYQRLLSSKNTTDIGNNHDVLNPKDFIKDPYVFEFLNIPEIASASEKDIETAFVHTHPEGFMNFSQGDCGAISKLVSGSLSWTGIPLISNITNTKLHDKMYFGLMITHSFSSLLTGVGNIKFTNQTSFSFRNNITPLELYNSIRIFSQGDKTFKFINTQTNKSIEAIIRRRR